MPTAVRAFLPRFTPRLGLVFGYGLDIFSASCHKQRPIRLLDAGFRLVLGCGLVRLGGGNLRQLTGPFPALLCDLNDFSKKRSGKTHQSGRGPAAGPRLVQLVKY